MQYLNSPLISEHVIVVFYMKPVYYVCSMIVSNVVSLNIFQFCVFFNLKMSLENTIYFTTHSSVMQTFPIHTDWISPQPVSGQVLCASIITLPQLIACNA